MRAVLEETPQRPLIAPVLAELAREFEARYRAFVSEDWLSGGSAELSWLVVEDSRIAQMPVQSPSGESLHEWWAVTMLLPSEELRALAWQHTEAQRAWSAPVRYIDAGHARVAHRVVGSGPDVVFVHGWPLHGLTIAVT